MGLGLAFKCFWRALTSSEFCTKVQPILTPPPPALPKPNPEPLRLITLLQREGRFIDFLQEDIQSYPVSANEQIGAAVRDIHKGCRKILQEHLTLEPVLAGEEQEPVTVAAGFDPSAVRLTGNVTGEPPFKGTLKHHGWRVKEVKLPPLPEGQDPFVVQPAEVEL